MCAHHRFWLKLILFTLYTISILFIAKQIFRANDNAEAYDDQLPRDDNRFQTEEDVYIMLRKLERSRYEQQILKLESGVVLGLGENGEAAYLDGDDRIEGKVALEKKALNTVLSNKISLTRELQDARHPMCANLIYDALLPSASVIIIFYNEPWSVLLRTVHSVLRNTPPRLLKEIILIDDHSEEEELQGLLDHYLSTRLPAKVKLLRFPHRKGLIRARLHGARSATGDVVAFLDAHCEVNKDWLQPLLQRIKDKRNAVVLPIINDISAKTLEFNYDDDPSFLYVGGFTWLGHYKWIKVQKHDNKSRTSPISPVRSPTMAGGLYAIDRKYFWKIGSYDDKMDGWGGENLEMSFRIWQCGGTLEVIPCSRVGHIFRDFHPYKFPDNKDTHGINTARLALVWMDEYKRLFFTQRSEFKNNPSLVGDVSARLKLREKLKCKSFKWYLDNIYPEKFIPDEHVVAYGRVKLHDSGLCLIENLEETDYTPYNLSIYTCLAKFHPWQLFSLTKSGEFRTDENCAKVSDTDRSESYAQVELVDCDEEASGRKWLLTKNGKIIHVETGLCLEGLSVHNKEIVQMATCANIPEQFWKFDFYANRKQSG